MTTTATTITEVNNGPLLAASFTETAIKCCPKAVSDKANQ